MSIRKSYFAGSFYPDSTKSLTEFFSHFNALLKQHDMQTKLYSNAIIVPHAGYVYSGFTANAVYANLCRDYRKVVVIGPSHKIYLKGCSAALYTSYQTPLGDLKIDYDLTQNLIENFAFCNFIKEAHQEHSTETQMPFIKHYFKDAEVVEIIYGDIDAKDLTQMIQHLFDPKTLIVISSDLSHFYDLKKANAVDEICLKSIASLDTDIKNSGCEACGIKGIEALLAFAKEKNMQTKLIDYRTSYDASGDSSSVVGYCSAAIYKER